MTRIVDQKYIESSNGSVLVVLCSNKTRIVAHQDETNEHPAQSNYWVQWGASVDGDRIFDSGYTSYQVNTLAEAIEIMNNW